MPIKLKRTRVSRGVSVDIETTWAAQGLDPSPVTNSTTMARFQQRQLMEKEQKLLQLYDQQQQRAHQVAQRGSAGSNTSNGSSSATTTQSVTRTTTTTSHSTSNAPGGKVRQMFDERRQTTVKGIDRSYPLEPLENKARKTIGPTSQRNGTTVTNRHSVTVKRTIRADTNGNVNSISSKPAINYHEDVTRETFGPKLVHREEDIEEFYNENDLYNQNISEANNHGTDRGRSIDRAKPAKGEVLIVAGTGPRKQESRRYRNMIKIELGRSSPEWRRSRGSPEGGRRSPGNVEKTRVRSVSRSPVHMHNPISGYCKINESKKNIWQSPVSRTIDTSGEAIFNKSEGGRACKTSRAPSPSSREKSTDDRKNSPVPPKNRSRSPQISVPSNDLKKSKDSEGVQSSTHRDGSPKLDGTDCKVNPRNRDVSPLCPRPYKLNSQGNDSGYPRRKSEFEKSRIFRKLQEELDRESPEHNVRPFSREKSPSPPKYNDSFLRIRDYPRRSSDFEKSDTFKKLQTSLADKKISDRAFRSGTPPSIVEASYNRLRTVPPDGKKYATTFNRLQEDLDRTSPESRSSMPIDTCNDYSKRKKKESEKSRIFKKLQMELSSSPEPTDEQTHRTLSPTRITIRGDQLEISNNFKMAHPPLGSAISTKIEDHSVFGEEKKSTGKSTLEDIDDDLPRGIILGDVSHKVVKKDKPTGDENISNRSKNGIDNRIYERTDSVESALQKFDSINNMSVDENSGPRVKKPSSNSRRSSLHAATESWTMKTRSANQHKPGSTPANASKTENKTRRKSTKGSKQLKAAKEVLKSPSASCKKRLFTDFESDTASKDNEGSTSTITISTFEDRLDEPVKTLRSFESTLEEPGEILRSVEQNVEEPSKISTSSEDESVKLLKSSKDIRNAMTRTTQFMDDKINKSTDNVITPKVTIRIISPNTARRAGYIKHCVEFGVSKCEDWSEINVKPARRIEKTPSPDDPSRRIISNETKNVRRNNSNITLTPTSRNSIKKKGPENSQSVDVVDSCKEDRARITTDNPTKDNLAFVIDLAEDTHSKASSHTKKASNDRQLSEKISSCESRQKGSSVRPASALSTNSSCTTQGGNSAVSKNRMAAKTRGVTSGNRTPSATKANNPSLSNADSGLPGCKICGRRFTPDRLSLHEQICVKATQKKRKTFDPVIQRTKGTELEPFVKKISKKGSDKKSKKPEGKSNWRRKHEDFINAIRSAKQMQAHLAAGGKLSDLPPPPASDTSDYIQCPHCGRKFNQAAAERHIPKCQHMLHNKPNPRAPPKAKR